MADAVPGRLLRKRVKVTSAGAAYDDLEIGPVTPGEQWMIDWASCVDETNAVTKRGFGIKAGGSIYWLREEAVTTSSLRHGRRLRVLLGAGESLVCRLTGCTSSDVLRAFAVGQYWEVRE